MFCSFHGNMLIVSEVSVGWCQIYSHGDVAVTGVRSIMNKQKNKPGAAFELGQRVRGPL